jgi:hypothetical protein
LGTHKHYPPPFFSVKVVIAAAQNKAKTTSIDLFITTKSESWSCSKTYKQFEDLSNLMLQLYPKAPALPRHSTFEPLFFGQADHSKATQAAQRYMDQLCRLPYSEFVTPFLEFLDYQYGLDCLNQMSKAREYKNKHGMTLTHFSMESGLELNYALFSRDSTQKGNSEINMSVLEGWETAEMVKKREKSGREEKEPDKPPEKQALPTSLKQTSGNTAEISEKGVEPVKASDNRSTKASSIGHQAEKVSWTGSFENQIKEKLADGVEALVKKTDMAEVPEKGSQQEEVRHHKASYDPMKSPRQELKSDPEFVNSQTIAERNRVSKAFQKKALGIFHKKQISRNIDCCVTCFETFSEADLIIAGLENGKIAAFKEVLGPDTDEFGLELLSRVKVFKEAVTHISLSSTKGVLYCVGDRDTLAVVDLASWKVVEKHNLGGVVTEFIYNEDYQVAFVANGQARVTLVNLAEVKKISKVQLKTGEDSPVAVIRHMDLDCDAGLLFFSDNNSGVVSVCDIEYPFSFQSKIALKSTAFGLTNCQDLTWWEARKEVYMGFRGGLISVHRLSVAGVLEFVTSCRVSTSDLNLVAHYGSCPYLFVAGTDGCLALWSPPARWLIPFDREDHNQAKADKEQTAALPLPQAKEDCYSDDDCKEREEHSPANSC